VNILLIRLRLIGDVVFTTPVIRALKRRFPQARLAYVVEPHARAVVEGNPHLDELIVAPAPGTPRRLGEDLALVRRLRASRYDLAIDLHGGPRSALLTWLSGATRRIGYEIPARRWMYTDRVARSRTLQPRHSVVNQWDLLGPLGFGEPDPEIDGTEMPFSAGAAASAAERLRAAGADPDNGRLVVVHVSAGNPFRRWPADAWVELLVRLSRAEAGRTLLVLSGPSERDAAREIGARARVQVGGSGGIVDNVDVDLVELRALLERSALFVGGDSGPLHVAGTTSVPIVGLYGPTLPARSAPWRPSCFVTESVELGELPCRPCHQRTCEPGDFRCLARITPARVADAAERALSRAAGTAHAPRPGVAHD
jgi:ADP-heptose:LPS heptosyltransferase